MGVASSDLGRVSLGDVAVLSIGGDASAIRSSATQWSMFAESTSAASTDIRRIDSGDFQGDEADLYRDKLSTDLRPHLDTASQAWSTVSTAMQTYATSLESLQQRMNALSAQAADQQTQATAANNAVADARTADAQHTAAVEAAQKALPAGQTLPADVYQPQTGAASGQLDAANAALQATTDAANQVHAEHNAALDACVSAINTAAGLRFQEPPGFWGRLGAAVGGWIRDHADVLTAISGVLKQISSIAGLLAMIPVLAPVMGPISAAAGAGSVVIDGAVVMATGKGSMKDVLIDAAGMLPGGRAAEGVAKGVKTVVEAKAAVGATKTAGTLAKDVHGVESVAAEAQGVDKAVAGADRAGGRAVNDADSAVAHDTPADSLPCVGDPIDVVTGEMVLIQTDVELPGVLPLVLKRVYKSGYRWGGAFGASWASTVDQRVEVGSDGAACYVAEDGVVMHYVGADSAAADVGLLPTEGAQRWPLRRAAGGGWLVDDPDRRVTRVFAAADEQGSCALLEIRDRHGNAIRFGYGDRGVVNEIRHSCGYRVLVASAGGLVTGLSVVEGPHERGVASFEYDGLGQLVRNNNAAGIPLTFQWESGRIVGWRDRNDIWYRYQYDESGRCLRTAGRGRVLSYGFSYLPGRTLVTDSLGAVATYEYNAAHQVTRTVDPLGNPTTSVWDRYDRLLLRTDPLGRSTQLEYDDSGRLIAVTRPDGSRELLRRNADGEVVEAVDATGAGWRYEYDSVGNLASTRDPLGAVTTWTYAAHGAVETATDPLGAVTTVQSNAAGLPVAVSDPLGATCRFEYDGSGRMVLSVDALGGVTSFGWTVNGKPAHRLGPDGAREEWAWDEEGNLTSFVDAAGARTTVDNGVFDLPVARTGPDGGRMTFGYDTELRLTLVQNPAGLRWQYEYDAAGCLVGETDFNGRTQRYRRDAAGQVVGIVNGLGQETTLKYDTVGLLVERATVDGLTRLSYDRSGRLVDAQSPGARVDIERDARGRVVKETVNGRTVTVAFDAAGRRVSQSTPAGVLSQWQFDAAGRPASLTTAGELVSFEHDDLGREVARGFAAGGRLEQRFDDADRLVGQLMAAVGPVPVPPIIGRSFDYRVDGALTAIVDTTAGTARRFDLDAAGRVVGVRAEGWTEGYAYDQSGRLARDGSAPELIGGHSTAPRAYEGTQVTRAGAVSYRHDRQGRVVTRSRKRLSQPPETWKFTYDTDDRMVEAVSAGQRWSYTYDAFGRRISKQRLGAGGDIVEQTVFTWEGDRLIEQSHTDGRGSAATVTTWEYLPGSWTPVSQCVGGDDVDARFYAIVSDLVGAPTELVTPDGRRVAWTSAEATVWGAPRHKAANNSAKYGTAEVDCPIRFPGQYADDETGLHYNRHRYYDPAAGRYTTTDPLGLAPADDPHGYVLNPTGWADPLGLTPCDPRAGSGSDSGPPALARSGHIDPSTVRFTQDSIRATFKDGGNVEELARNLQSGVIEPSSIPAIRVFERDGLIHTLDNRRLAAFQRAGIKIPYRFATPREIANELTRKSSTKNGGTSIEVRGTK